MSALDHMLPLARTRPLRWQPALFVLLAAACGVALIALPLPQAVLVLGIPAVVIATAVQPLAGLAVALLLGPLGALESQRLGGSALDSGQVMLLLTLAIWLARGMVRHRVTLRRTFITLPLLFWMAVAAVSGFGSVSAAFSVRELLKWVEIALIIWLIVDLGSETDAHGRRRMVVWLVAMLLLAGVSQALFGIWQFLLWQDGPDHFLVLGRFYRAYGAFEQPNPFGGFMNFAVLLGLGVVLGLATAVVGRWRRRAAIPRSWWVWLLAAGAATAVTGIALVFSWSRGAWLGFAAGAATVAFFWPRRLRWGVTVVVAAAVVLAAAYALNAVPATITERLAGFTADLTFGDVRGVDIDEGNYAVLERLAHWQAALDMARDRFWTGVGFGSYAAAYDDYRLINWPDALGHAHNYYINLLAEVGLPGLLAYLVLWTAVVWQTIRVLRHADWPLRGVALGLMGAWAALSVHHLVDKLYVNNIYVHLGVMFGLLQLLDFAPDAATTGDRVA